MVVVGGGRAGLVSWGHVPAAPVVVLHWLVLVALVGGVLLLVAFAAGPALVVVFDACALAVGEAVLGLPASSGAECIELGVELRLRLDEAAAVVAHGLVACVWVL